MNTRSNPQNNDREIPKKTAMRRKCDFKKLISHFDLNVFWRVVWILSQIAPIVLKLRQKNLHGQKSAIWKTALIPQYLLTRKLSIISWVFSLFSASLTVVSTEMGYQYVSSLTQLTMALISKIEKCDCLFCFCQSYQRCVLQHHWSMLLVFVFFSILINDYTHTLT